MNLVRLILTLYIWILVVTALLSWFPTTSSSGGLAQSKRVAAQLTEPVLRPLRQILPRPNFGGVGIDLSVIVAILILTLVRNFI